MISPKSPGKYTDKEKSYLNSWNGPAIVSLAKVRNDNHIRRLATGYQFH